MEVTTITSKKMSQFTELEFNKEVFNTEGKIYKFIDRRKPKILKRLYMKSGETFAGKIYTLEMLDLYKEYLPDMLCIPDSLAVADGQVIGFTIPFIEGINLASFLSDNKIENQEKIYYLKQIGKLLEDLKHMRSYTPLNNFYINDLHEANFIVDPKNKRITEIDLDSCKIANNIAFPSRYLIKNSLASQANVKYKHNIENLGPGHIIADENSDLYCYCIIILNFLLGRDVCIKPIPLFFEYLNYLEAIGINRELINIFSDILVNKKNENPIDYLDSLTDEQICRAKDNVYRLTKNKVSK